MVNSCARCSAPINPDNIHHINGTHEDDSPHNKIGLCPKCHDFIQAVCDKCRGQGECHKSLFIECWRFEAAIPPIHFRIKEGTVEEVVEPEEEPLYEERFERVALFGKVRMTRVFCAKCGGYSLRVDGRLLCCAPSQELAPSRPYRPPLLLQARCGVCKKWFWNSKGRTRHICPECRTENVISQQTH
jgi:hypothetical protein